MGISTHYYTIHGVKLDWNDDFNEAYDEVYDDEDTPFTLIDCMECEYIILGTPLFDSGDLRWGEDGETFAEIDLNALSDFERDYKQKFIEKFPEFSGLMNKPFKLMTLVHFS